MTNLINTFEKEQIERLTLKKRIPAFRSGDTMKVSLKIIEGERSRLHIFEGVCISRKNNGLNSNFTIRKISHGEGVERVFPLFSPLISKIEVVRKGDVRRAKLYYLRDRKGKRARIADSNRGEESDQYELIETPAVNQSDQKASEKSEDTITEEKSKDLLLKDKEQSETKENNQEEVKNLNNSVEEKSESPAIETENSGNEQKS